MEKQLPKNWAECTLGELATVQSGGTPSRGINSYWNGDIPWVKISDIKEMYVNKTTEFITEEGLKNSSTRIFPKGTILFTIFATLGKIGILNIDAATNQAIAGITPSKAIDDKYLTYALIDLSNSISEYGKGVAQKNINQAILKDTLIPLPPLPEQQRIVAKLDTLFAQLETIKTSMANIPLLLKDFRQQVLTQAVTGKLTEEWRKGKNLTSLNLINKLKSKHSDLGGHKKGNAANHDIVKHKITFNELPNSWNVLEMKDICKPEKPITYGILMPGPEITDGKPYLKVMSYPNNSIDFTKIRHTSDIIEANFKRSRLSHGDIVLSIRGTVGRIIIIPEVLEGANLTQDSARLSIQNGMNNFYVAIALKSKLLQDVMDSVTKGVAVRGINIGDVRHLRIPIPDLIEQNEIVTRVESLFAKADAIEQQYKTLKASIDNLPQAILHKAFKGELTEQLDSDGDARELLQQIQELKTSAVKPKKATSKKTKSYPEGDEVLGMVAEK